MPCVIDKDKNILTPIPNIIDALQRQVALMGINKLKDVSYKASDAIVTCPIHKLGCENKPSCYVLLNDKGGNMAGTVHCFTCGYRANLTKFVADCLGTSYRNANEWLLGFVDYEVLYEDGLDFSKWEDEFDKILNEVDEPKASKDPYKDIKGVSVDELKQYDYIHPYMFQRKFNDWAIDKFEIGYDPKTEALTFPVYVNGKCLFVARRKVKYKRFDMPALRPKPIYGVDYLDDNKEVIVCESVINAITCWMYGRQAVALFGTGSKEQIEELKKLPQLKIVVCLDNDDAGENGTNRIINGLSNKIVTRLKVPKGKDVNDLTKEEFDALEEEIF